MGIDEEPNDDSGDDLALITKPRSKIRVSNRVSYPGEEDAQKGSPETAASPGARRQRGKRLDKQKDMRL